MKVLITLGPTQEPIDAIRYITNASSGKMGAALAKESVSRGYETTIVSGPVNIKLPCKARVLRVRTAKEMMETSLKELREGYDIFISTAAIADYTPQCYEGKIKSGKADQIIKLKENPKLTRCAKERFPKLFVVAFKAEYNISKESLIESAWTKLNCEGLDLIVANDLKNTYFGDNKTEAHIINKEKNITYIRPKSKNNTAKDIWKSIEDEVTI